MGSGSRKLIGRSSDRGRTVDVQTGTEYRSGEGSEPPDTTDTAQAQGIVGDGSTGDISGSHQSDGHRTGNGARQFQPQSGADARDDVSVRCSGRIKSDGGCVCHADRVTIQRGNGNLSPSHNENSSNQLTNSS